MALALFVLAGTASAEELHVPSQYPTIQSAIDAAVDGDEIIIAAGIYRESGEIPSGFLDLTISGQGTDETVLSGDLDNNGQGDSVILNCSSGADPLGRLHIRDITFRDANGPAFRYTQRRVGGATITIERCDFIENRSIEYEGAVFAFNTSGLFVTDCRFVRNHGRVAGAISYTGYSVQIVRSQFLGNSSSDTAGAVRYHRRNTQYDQDMRIEQSVFVGNTGNDVGAIGVAAPLYIDGCTFFDNRSANNTASVIFSYLTPDSFGRLTGGPVEGYNTIVSPSDSTPEFAIFPAVSWTSGLGPVPSGNSILLDPLFVRTPSDGGDGWGDNPLTPDIDEGVNDDFGDLRLLNGSPAIERGYSQVVAPGAVDLDHNPRIVDDPGIPGDSVDIGAFEFQSESCLPDMDLDGTLTPADFSAWVAAFNLNHVRADQNRDGSVSPADFSIWVANYNAGC